MSKHKRRAGPPCTRCTRPAGGFALCTGCTAGFRHLLTEIPALVAELGITRARQDRMRGQAVGIAAGHTEAGPLWNEAASRATRVLHAALVDQVHQLTGRARRADTITALAGQLLARLDTLRLSPRASAVMDTLDQAVKRARRAIDRPADLVYGGPCDQCSTDLYVAGNATHFTCPGCGVVYGFEQRREWLLTATENSLLTASEASRALSGLLDRDLSPNTIRTWARNGRLTAHGDDHGRPLYRVGDLVHLARTTATRQRRVSVA